MAKTRVDQVKVGDLLDLSGDKYADQNDDNIIFECELQAVCQIEQETPDCIVLYIEGGAGYGMPPDHLVDVMDHDFGYDEK